MNNTKKMLNFFMILGLISAILVAVSIFGYRYYLIKNNSELNLKAEIDREEIKNKVSEINSGQPEISIKNTAKPYLRYLKIKNGLELSYELCFENSGNHAATDFKYDSINQKLIINKEVIYSGHKSDNDPPKRIVANDKFCQIFKVTNKKMTAEQVNHFINQFELNNVSISLEIKYSYKDEITGKEYSFTEKNNIKTDRVEIY